MLPQVDGFQKYCVIVMDKYVGGKPVCIKDYEPLLDTRVYYIHFDDWRVKEYSKNIIVENIYLQVGINVCEYLLIDFIVEHESDGTVVKGEDDFYGI